MTTDADPARFLIIGPMGEADGPVDITELRRRLTTGRFLADDRLRDAVTGNPIDLLTVIPDAEALVAEARKRTSDRIRRRTSDRQAAYAEAQAARPKPVVDATTAQAPEEAPEALPVTSVKRSALSKSQIMTIAIAVVVITMATLLWESFEPSRDSMDPQRFQGTWIINEAGMTAWLAPLPPEAKTTYASLTERMRVKLHGMSLTLKDNRLTVRTNGTTTDHTMTFLEASESFAAFNLTPPHPVLGPNLQLDWLKEGPSLRMPNYDAPIPLMPQ